MWECVHIPGYRQAERDGRRWVPDRLASGRVGKDRRSAQRTASGRGGRPQGRRTFGSVKSSTALLLEKVAKAQMFVYSAAEKESAWKD